MSGNVHPPGRAAVIIRLDVLGDGPGVGDSVDVAISLELHFQVGRAELFFQLSGVHGCLHNTIEPLERIFLSKLEEACFPPPRKENPRCLLVRLRFWDLATIAGS